MLTVQKETTENGALKISAHTIKETIYPQQIIPMQYMTENYTHAHRDHPRTHAHKGSSSYPCTQGNYHNYTFIKFNAQ